MATEPNKVYKLRIPTQRAVLHGCKTVADAKRGDIGSTSAAYAEAYDRLAGEAGVAMPARDAQAAFDALLQSCTDDADCRGRHPRLRDEWSELLAAFPYRVNRAELHRDARYLSSVLHRKGDWTGIIAITRGGLVPAALVARELEIRLIDTVCVVSYGAEAGGAAEQRQGRQETREHDEKQADPVDAQGIVDIEGRDPRTMLGKLEQEAAPVEVAQQVKGQPRDVSTVPKDDRAKCFMVVGLITGRGAFSMSTRLLRSWAKE